MQVEFIGQLTRSGSAYKIAVPGELVESKQIQVGSVLSARVMLPEKPFKVIVPTMQTKLARFPVGNYGLLVDPAFLSGILRQRALYKVQLLNALE
jgi:hypothetical protein